MKSPEYWNEKYFMDDNIQLEKVIELAQTEAYNQGVKDAAENAKVEAKVIRSSFDILTHELVVDKQSILKLLKP